MHRKPWGTTSRTWVVVAVLGLSACGSTTDDAPAYVANWTTQATINAGGSSETGGILLPIQRTDTNVIELQGFCSDTDIYASGPVADVTTNGFTIRPGSCSFSSTACSTGNFSFAWTSGSGTLSNGQLTGSFSGTVSCSTVSVTYTITFTSTSKVAYGSSETAHGSHGLAEALRLLQK